MLFEIKTLTGKKYKVNSASFSTVLDIKTYLQEWEGISASQIRLLSKGRQLADNMSISSIIESDMQIIHMILALRGG